MLISVQHKGNFKKTTDFLEKMKRRDVTAILNKYGKRGVQLLSDATPVRTGKTAQSWNYEITSAGQEYSITFTNSNINKNVNIALILQYGHGTRQGGYVQGRDYINPPIQSVFDEMVEELWREVSQS